MRYFEATGSCGSYIPLNRPFEGGYRPPKQTDIETQIENAWSDSSEARRLVEIWVRHRVAQNAVRERLDESERGAILAWLLEEADGIVSDCRKRGYSPFAAVSELHSFLAEFNLID